MSMTIPDGATVPQDHKKSKVQQFEDGLTDLGLNATVLPLGLRPRQRNAVLNLAFRLREAIGAEDGDQEVDVDTDDLSDEQTKLLLDVIADFDELIADEATDRQAYDTWSRLSDLGQLGALLTLYSGLLGESTSSTN